LFYEVNSMSGRAEPFWSAPVNSALRLATFIGCHTFVTLVLIGCSRLVAMALDRAGDPRVFDYMPFRYFFDLMDVVFITIFIAGTFLSAKRAFKENDDG